MSHFQEKSLSTYFENLLAILPGYVYWKDKAGVYLGCNDAYAQYLGLSSRADIVGKTDYDFSWKEKADVIRENDLTVMTTGKSSSFKEFSPLMNSKEIIFLTHKSPMLNALGEIIGVIGVSLDITVQEQTENALRQAKDEKLYLLENIIGHMPGHIYWKDQTGSYLGCNDAQAKSLGLQKGLDVVGKTDFDLPWGANQAALFRKNDLEVMNTKKIKVSEEQAVVNDRKATVLSSKVPLYDKNNDVIGILGISIDISDRKRAEQAEARAQVEEEFRQAVMILSGSVAHDFRTPLAILRMIMEGINRDLPKLLEGCLAAQAAALPLKSKFDDRDIQILEKRLHDGVATIQELNEIIDNNLKTLSRSTLKELTMGDLVKCSSYHCLHNALTRYPLAEHQRDLIKYDGSYYFDFMGNELLMIRVLTNLIKNALEQIDENQKGDIKIWSQKHDNENTIHIRDTAGGCAPEFLDKLFSGFYTTKKGGTGIGLAFCKKTLNSFGADITCHSVHGDYMEFVLIFPKI